jgi:hypothetical protein
MIDDREFDQLLTEAAAEERRENEIRRSTPVPNFNLPPKKKTDTPPELSADADPEAFLSAVADLLMAISPKRADHQPFTDRCIACERRGVHNRVQIRCECPCHRVRTFLGQ